MAGMQGLKGDKGDQGAQGAPGVEGPQGVQGPAGAVLVIDGGVISGPPGSSVLVSTINPGSATCPTGGVRVTQLSDGGITNVCNGAVGPQGDAGARGPIGPAGPAGPAGASPTATVLPLLSPACATGGVMINLPDAGSFPICNGSQGPAGMTGATGAQGPAGMQGVPGMTGATGAQGPAGMQGVPGMTGATGAQGPAGMQGVPGMTGATGVAGPPGATGPQGPAGSVLYLDGGVVVLSEEAVQFVGFTVATYNGNLGGYPGAHQKCAAEFTADSYLCTIPDYDQANTTVVPPSAAGAWIDFARSASGARYGGSCSATGNTEWTSNNPGHYGSNVNAVGSYYTTLACSLAKPLACCRGGTSSKIFFRGFTTATYTGDLGGYPGATAKCRVQYPGSFLCTIADYDRTNTTAVPPTSAGSWIDFDRRTDGSRENSSCSATGNTAWTSANSSHYGANLNSVSGYYTTLSCSTSKHLACCQNR